MDGFAELWHRGMCRPGAQTNDEYVMALHTSPRGGSRDRQGKLHWAGWIIAVPAVALLIFSAAMKLNKSPQALEGIGHFGWKESSLLPLGILELVCVVVYLSPRTAVLGAILLTGYLGGATATHARLGESFIIPVVMGMILWLGLYLRDPRVRALVPISR